MPEPESWALRAAVLGALRLLAKRRRLGHPRPVARSGPMLQPSAPDPSASAAGTHAADWPAIEAARAHDPGARVAFFMRHAGQPQVVGSVARAHLPVLSPWPEALQIDGFGVTLTLEGAECTRFFEHANRSLHQAGLIRGWRDETFPVLTLQGGVLLASVERAAARFWGSTTFGAHCNGYTTDGRGRPAQLWIARRAFDKATDPGLLDNLIGGGVALGQTPAQAVLREGWEEAGLLPVQMQGLTAGRRLRLARDVAEGFQREELSVFDLALPPDLLPRNQDGEVHSHSLMTIDQALAHAASGDMTVDAALVTLDFALRRRLLPPKQHQHLQALAEGLWTGRSSLDR